MNAKLPGAKFTLADMNNAEKITELEFYHKVGHYSEKYINAFFDKPIKMKQAGFSGIVKGFIDMVFKLKGKYYIVDWKSNFLGNTLATYSPQNLEKAMQEHNYHLQYFIYTQALKSYLELIDPDFVFKRDFGGVYYVFLIVCRAGEEHGVYYYR